MKFRFHRGGYDKSMATEIHVSSREELIEAIQAQIDKGMSFPVEEIKFDYAGFDDRCNWDTWHVSIKWPFEWNWGVVGMSDGVFPTLP